MSESNVKNESSSNERRFLHFTMKISDRRAAKKFFCDILGMKILRHEEMGFACTAQCNGNFQSPWSKTMVGYGDEHSFFALELNFNYEVEAYEFGNDFSSLTIRSRKAVSNAREHLNKSSIEQDATDSQPMLIRTPDGLRVILIDDDVSEGEDPVQCLSLNVSDLRKSVDYYSRLLKMQINQAESTDDRVRLYYGSRTNGTTKSKTKSNFLLDQQCQLELVGLNQPINRATGYGRKAICCPTIDVERIQADIEKEGFRVFIPTVELGDSFDANKVKVVILSDPDGHEICFVGEENYFGACQTNPKAQESFDDGLFNETGQPKKYSKGEDESNRKR